MAAHPQRVLAERIHELSGLCAGVGVGGLDLGLHIAEPGYRTVGFVERNSFAASVLVARMEGKALAPAPVWDDLKTFDGRPWRGRVHLDSAGDPCQPFTLSGLRQGENDPRHLWPDVARIIEEVQPGTVFFENVAGHLTLGLQDVCRDLQGMGYRVAARVVSAAEVGASQIRDRVFILGHADVQELGQPGGDHAGSGPVQIPERPEPDRHTNRPAQSGGRLDDVEIDPGRGGLGWVHVPLFPPTPGDLAEWRETLAARPDLEPSVHRLADGMATWVDRTAAAGNGVVPLAAALAYRTLKATLTGVKRGVSDAF